MSKKLLIIAEERYLEIAKEIANATQDFDCIELKKDVKEFSKNDLLTFDHILLAGTAQRVELWGEHLQEFERKLLFLSLTTSSGMAYKVKIKPKMPEDYKFDEVM